MKLTTRLFLLIAFNYIVVSQSLVLNEIMYAPLTGTGKEWFELYNNSQVNINIKGWKWKDATTSIRTITNLNISIEPGNYVLICEDTIAAKQFYSNLSGILIQSNGWNAINNTGDQVIIYDSSGNKIDSINFLSSWGGNVNNKSLERINSNAPTNQQTNWGSSQDLTGATPNRKNSISQKSNDLVLYSLTINKINPFLNDTVVLSINIKNKGLQPASGYSIKLYFDSNYDSIPQNNEIFKTLNPIGTLNYNDSIKFNENIIVTSLGLKQYIAAVYHINDEDTLNNIKVIAFNVENIIQGKSILINEIMFDYPPGENEWVEIINKSDTVINLKNWKIKDNSTNIVNITQNDYLLYPDSIAVISENNNLFQNHPTINPLKIIINSQLPDLNNTGDAVLIINPSGNITDSLFYQTSWGGKDASLERISFNVSSTDPNNWMTSIDCEKSTPTKSNSITNSIKYEHQDIIINEIMYDPLSKEAEWIELFNKSSKYINLSGWIMYETGGSLSISDTCNSIVQPGAFIIIASDSTIYNRYIYLKHSDTAFVTFITNKSLNLNNTSDLINITDIFKGTIDSLYYNDSWHNDNLPSTNGISLERINYHVSTNDPDNWNSSADPNGGTPGKRNSIFTQNENVSSDITISPNPFSPDGDGYEDHTLINYKLQSPYSQIRVKIFDVKGRQVRTLVNNMNSGPEGSIIFNGLDDENRKLRLGIYILLLESLNDQNGVVEILKTTLVIAARL